MLSGLGFLRCRWTFGCGNVAVGLPLGAVGKCRWPAVGHLVLDMCRWAGVGRRWKSAVGQPLDIFALGAGQIPRSTGWAAGPLAMTAGPLDRKSFLVLKCHSGRWPAVGNAVGRCCHLRPQGPKGRILFRPHVPPQRALAWHWLGTHPLPLGCRWDAVGQPLDQRKNHDCCVFFNAVGLPLAAVGNVPLVSRWTFVFFYK